MLGPVSISIPTLVVELVIFLMTVFLMERLLFDPIRSAWAEREDLIREGLNASSSSREDMERAREEVKRILSDARRTAQTKIDRATEEGNRVRDEKLAAATAEFRRLLDQARAEIQREREEVASSLRQRVVDLALLAASRVTGQSFDKPEVRELAASVVEREGLN
jgi:F-type H+-transporting ATPase subunit b